MLVRFLLLFVFFFPGNTQHTFSCPSTTRREHTEEKFAKMGIKQLFQIIKEEAPDAIKEGEIKNQFGRKVAIVSRYPDLPGSVKSQR